MKRGLLLWAIDQYLVLGVALLGRPSVFSGWNAIYFICCAAVE